MDDVIEVWKEFVDSIDNWQEIIQGVTPKQTICGPVYERTSPIPERTETFAISDMRNVKVAHPHYHKNGETEIYFALQGSGLTVVGGQEIALSKGSVVITPPETAHFTVPKHDLVMVVINSPSFSADNNIELTQSDPRVKFDKSQYDRLTANLGSTV